MVVKLLTYTDLGEKITAAAGKLCYSSANIDTIFDGLDDDATGSFVDMLMSVGHQSTIEHLSFTFAVENVSRTLLAQLTRHRIASFSVQSQRYVAEKTFEYVIPPEIEKNEEAKKIFITAMNNAQDSYIKLIDILKVQKSENLKQNGKSAEDALKSAEKAVLEDARFVLPNACDTKLIMTMNARSLLNFFMLRCCKRAQWEINAMAVEMLRLCKQAAPHIFAKAGPNCLRGACPEGSRSCGKAVEMKEFFAKL